jgi:hypothetical protein
MTPEPMQIPAPSRDTPEFVRDELFRVVRVLERVDATTASNTAAIGAVAEDVRETRALLVRISSGKSGGFLTGVTGWQRMAMWTSTLAIFAWVISAAINGFLGVASDPATIPAVYSQATPVIEEEEALSPEEVARLKELADRVREFIGTEAEPDAARESVE